MCRVTPRVAFSTKRLVSSSFINVGNNNQKRVFTYIVYLHYIAFFLKKYQYYIVCIIYQVTIAAFFLSCCYEHWYFEAILNYNLAEINFKMQQIAPFFHFFPSTSPFRNRLIITQSSFSHSRISTFFSLLS